MYYVKNTARIHIKPDDVLADIDEVPDEPRSRCLLYIEPYGPFELNEVGEANYFIGNRVPYHEHATAYETFLVDGGALEVMSRSRMAVAKKGDLVHIQPFIPHSIHSLADDTIWRAFHQGHSLIPNMIAERRLQNQYPETFSAPDFRQGAMAQERKSFWFDYGKPECVEVPVSEFPEIRAFDAALAEFNFDKLNLKLKVGRWETGGAKEVWQLTMGEGCTLSWAEINIFPLLFDVYEGAVEVKLDGMDAFTANTRDLLHIPKYLGGSLTALQDTVLLDMGCQGYFMRFLDELNAVKTREPAKLEEEAFLPALMKKYGYYIRFAI